MFQRRILSMLVIGLAFSSAHAAENSRSEFFFQSEAGQSNVTPHVGYRTATVKPEGGGADLEQSGLNRLGVQYEYGINEMFSVGADVSFSSFTSDPGDQDVSGLEDPTIFLKGTSVMEFGRLRYGATLGLGGLQNSEDDNLMTGGFRLAPYVGLDIDAGPGILGARLSYAYLFDRTSEDAAGTETDTEGGNVLGLAAFYEYMLSDMLLGIDFHYDMNGETEDAGVKQNDDGNLIGTHLYARIPAMENMVVVPRLGWDFSNSRDGVDSWNDLTLDVNARWTF